MEGRRGTAARPRQTLTPGLQAPPAALFRPRRRRMCVAVTCSCLATPDPPTLSLCLTSAPLSPSAVPGPGTKAGAHQRDGRHHVAEQLLRGEANHHADAAHRGQQGGQVEPCERVWVWAGEQGALERGAQAGAALMALGAARSVGEEGFSEVEVPVGTPAVQGSRAPKAPRVKAVATSRMRKVSTPLSGRSSVTIVSLLADLLGRRGGGAGSGGGAAWRRWRQRMAAVLCAEQRCTRAEGKPGASGRFANTE